VGFSGIMYQPPQAEFGLYFVADPALDGRSVAMGPTALVADDLAQRRLVAPFPGPLLPARNYCTYVPEAKEEDEVTVAFLSWRKREGNVLAGPPESRCAARR
jgi:LysR family glycine cleavage system transcriptional activator